MTSADSLFGTGLIEISAIATLVGASTAASLALGNKAAAGLPWACASTFGAIQVAKASFSASIPDLAREAVGLSNEEVQTAVGKMEEIKEAGSTPSDDAAEISAIKTHRFSPFFWRKAGDKLLKGNLLPSRKNPGKGNGQTLTAIYSLDTTSRTFERAIPISVHQTIRIHHTRSREVGSSVRSSTPMKDWIILLASLSKLSETGVLWYLNADQLWWSSSVAWLTSFCGAFVLQLLHLSRDDIEVAYSNLLLGQFPTPLKPGGKGNVMLGTAGNVRRHWAWRVVWFVNTVAVIFSLLSVFLSLPTLPAKTLYVWVAFQTFFTLARVLVHHFTLSASSTEFILASESWEESSASTKRQTLQLLMGLAQYNTTIHPRGPSPYKHSLTSFEAISLKFASCAWRLTEAVYLPSLPGPKGTITFMDVIPDTVFSSIAWALDRQRAEFYDAAIAFVDNKAIPCVRVYTCFCKGIPTDGTMRGMAHNCGMIKWLFWIPCCNMRGDEEGYLAVFTDDTHNAINEYERIDHQTLHTTLSKRVTNLSITHGDEVSMILKHTRELAKQMVQMFKESQGVQY